MEVDLALGQPTPNGVGGYATSYQFGKEPHILAHGGAGGSIGWSDLDAGLAVVITHNRMFGALPLDQNPFAPIARAVQAVAAELRSSRAVALT